MTIITVLLIIFELPSNGPALLNEKLRLSSYNTHLHKPSATQTLHTAFTHTAFLLLSCRMLTLFNDETGAHKSVSSTSQTRLGPKLIFFLIKSSIYAKG